MIKPSVVVPSGAGPAPTDTGGKGGEGRQRAYALPARPHVEKVTGGGTAISGTAGYATFNNYYNDVYAYDSSKATLKPLRVGSKVIGGTVLGRVGTLPAPPRQLRDPPRRQEDSGDRPEADPRRLEAARGDRDLPGHREEPADRQPRGRRRPAALQGGAPAPRPKDPRLSIYSCGRSDIASGQIDRRLLAAMEYLVEKGFRLTITSLKCGHSFLTSSGNVSEHTTGDAMDIAVINDVPVTGHQGPGGLPDALIKSLLQLQGTMAPHQIISLEDLPGVAELRPPRPLRPRPRRLLPRLRRRPPPAATRAR